MAEVSAPKNPLFDCWRNALERSALFSMYCEFGETTIANNQSARRRTSSILKRR